MVQFMFIYQARGVIKILHYLPDFLVRQPRGGYYIIFVLCHFLKRLSQCRKPFIRLAHGRVKCRFIQPDNMELCVKTKFGLCARGADRKVDSAFSVL